MSTSFVAHTHRTNIKIMNEWIKRSQKEPNQNDQQWKERKWYRQWECHCCVNVKPLLQQQQHIHIRFVYPERIDINKILQLDNRLFFVVAVVQWQLYRINCDQRCKFVYSICNNGTKKKKTSTAFLYQTDFCLFCRFIFFPSSFHNHMQYNRHFRKEKFLLGPKAVTQK